MTISTPVRPTGEQAKEAQECLESLKENHSSLTVTVKLEGGAEFEVPEFAFRFLFQLLQMQMHAPTMHERTEDDAQRHDR